MNIEDLKIKAKRSKKKTEQPNGLLRRLSQQTKMAISGAILGAMTSSPLTTPVDAASYPDRAKIVVQKTDVNGEKIKIDPGEPTLRNLRRKNVFDTDKWSITASSQAFNSLARGFASAPEGRKLLDKEEINILVPAAGILLSPLEMSFVFAEKSNNLNQINFTYTEIDHQSYEKIDKYLEKLVNSSSNLANLRVIEMRNENDSKLKQMSFDYVKDNGKKVHIKINFEYKMSGEAFFREESLINSDIVIAHDMDSSQEDDAARTWQVLLQHSSIAKLTNKKHYLILQNDPVVHDGLGEKVAKSSTFFGCREHNWDHKEWNEEVIKQEYGKTVEQYLEGKSDGVVDDNQNGVVLEMNTKVFNELFLAGGMPALELFSAIYREKLHKIEDYNDASADLFTRGVDDRDISNLEKILIILQRIKNDAVHDELLSMLSKRIEHGLENYEYYLMRHKSWRGGKWITLYGAPHKQNIFRLKELLVECKTRSRINKTTFTPPDHIQKI